MEWMAQYVLLTLIHWIAIYLADSIICSLNNLGPGACINKLLLLFGGRVGLWRNSFPTMLSCNTRHELPGLTNFSWCQLLIHVQKYTVWILSRVFVYLHYNIYWKMYREMVLIFNNMLYLLQDCAMIEPCHIFLYFLSDHSLIRFFWISSGFKNSLAL